MGAKKKKSSPKPKTTGSLSPALSDFDYRVDCDDFLLYELGRLIDEDRASLEEEEFRRLVDEGIHEHIESRLEIRAEMAMRLRQLDSKGVAIARVLPFIEDIESPLRELEVVVRSYTAYLFRRLEECLEQSRELDDDACDWVDRWQRGEVLREEMSLQLKKLGPAAVAAVADLLFDSPDDRTAAETALDILGAIRSSVSARILAHVISEPMLEEDLELTAYALLRAMWPLPRHYISYSLKSHTHDDIPIRWFQLLIESDDPAAADRVLEEVAVHSDNPDFREDLLALVELLRQSRDPNLEAKLLQMVNSPSTPRAAVRMIEDFLKQPAPAVQAGATGDAWETLERLRRINKKYRAAAKLFDTGRKAESLATLDELLNEEPHYPFALMLKRLI